MTEVVEVSYSRCTEFLTRLKLGRLLAGASPYRKYLFKVTRVVEVSYSRCTEFLTRLKLARLSAGVSIFNIILDCRLVVKTNYLSWSIYPFAHSRRKSRSCVGTRSSIHDKCCEYTALRLRLAGSYTSAGQDQLNGFSQAGPAESYRIGKAIC